MWLPGLHWSQIALFFFLLFCLYLYDTCFTIYVLNHCALSTGITDNPDERAEISMINTYVNMVPGAIVAFIPTFVLTSDMDYWDIILIFSAEGLLSIVDINGGLIGGASLKVDDFKPIIQAAIKKV